MRQFFSWRIWAALGALVGLIVLLRVVLPADATKPPDEKGPPDRHVDLVSLVYEVRPAAGFSIRNGVVLGSVDLVLDGLRTMHVLDGTLGDIDCEEIDQIGRCVVVADLLGEAVVWFALVPLESGLKAHAPPIVDILDGGIAQLANGWLVRTAESIDRQCDEETSSLVEFLERFGPGSTTVIDIARQRITIVRCANASSATSTTSTTFTTPTTVAGSTTAAASTTSTTAAG